MLGSISDTALSALNKATASNDILCPFTDTYSKETILRPWDLSRDSVLTPYIIRDNLGKPTSYDRIGSEDGETYLERVYNKAGVCLDPSNCCIQTGTFSSSDSCNSIQAYDDCDYGANCEYPCEYLKEGIVEGFRAFENLYHKEQAMTADLGIICPVFDDTCPTQVFKTQHSNLTLVEMIEDYKGKIIGTKNRLVNLASTSVGDAMMEVEDFLCNMNVSFVERRYNEVKNDICGTMFGGLAQINWGLWLLGISLEMVAILAHILTVRLRGLSQKEAAFTMLDWIALLPIESYSTGPMEASHRYPRLLSLVSVP